MNQPKFKFGDKVRTIGSPDDFFFRVDGIKIETGGLREFMYAESNSDFYRESKLELYQEPKKKKLYAFMDTMDTSQHVMFLAKEPEKRPAQMKRAPEYDIEYPDKLWHLNLNLRGKLFVLDWT